VALSLDDASSIAVIKSKLASPYPGELLYALDLLEQAEQALPENIWRELLQHPNATVRREVVLRLERLQLQALLPTVQRLASTDKDPAVRAAALQTMCALSQPGFIDQILPYLEESNAQVRRGAMVGLLRAGGIEGVLAAGQKLIEMANAADSRERVLAAQILGAIGIESFYRPLVKLIHDPEPEVQKAAVAAAAKIKNPALWPLIIESAQSPQVRPTAMVALISGGEATLPAVAEAMATPDQTREIIVYLAQVCGRIRSPKAISLLEDKMRLPDGAVRSRVLWALSRCGYRPQGEAHHRIRQQIHEEVAQATWLLAALIDIGDEANGFLLRRALEQALLLNRDRLFYLLSFLYDAQTILRARNDLSHTSREKRAYALEALDITLDQATKEVIFPLLQELTLQQRLKRLASLFPQSVADYHVRLAEIIQASEVLLPTWPKACALYAASQVAAPNGASSLVQAIHIARTAPDRLVCETAEWAWACLNGQPILAGAKGESVMLSTIEKVLILKTLDTFAQIPDDILAELALRLDTSEVAAGDSVFHKGEYGNSMYIIIDGKVRVHDGERTLNYLGERDVFGEMAILDPAPRVASITAVERTRLLCLDQETLYELMEDHSEVAQGIIRVLSQHLRARVQDIDELRTQVERLLSQSERERA
jgi:HEAT repeat protein